MIDQDALTFTVEDADLDQLPRLRTMSAARFSNMDTALGFQH